MPDTISVNLTGRAPMRIVKKEWPVVAHSSHFRGTGPEDRSDEWTLLVRRNADGRMLVTGYHAARRPRETRASGGILLDYLASHAELLEAVRKIGLPLHPAVVESCLSMLKGGRDES